jgi:hypothetical protein
LLDAGEVAVDSIAVVAATISQALTRGMYHLAIVTDGTPTIVRHNLAYSVNGLASTDFNTATAYPRGSFTVSFSYAALPDPFTAGGSLTWFMAGVQPRISSLD